MKELERSSELCRVIGYTFRDDSLLRLALTHCSLNGTDGANNQRLEYLGDAVLELVVSEWLYQDSEVDEGHLTRMRAETVCEESWAQVARRINLGRYLFLGKGEEVTGGRDKPSILSDALEALWGAIYLDGGLDAARGCIMGLIQHSIKTAIEVGGTADAKTRLQQFCAQNNKKQINYVLVETQGPPHAPVFTVSLLIDGSEAAVAKGKSKKEAEQRAAQEALKQLCE